jgi:hypothetical protein
VCVWTRHAQPAHTPREARCRGVCVRLLCSGAPLSSVSPPCVGVCVRLLCSSVLRFSPVCRGVCSVSPPCVGVCAPFLPRVCWGRTVRATVRERRSMDALSSAQSLPDKPKTDCSSCSSAWNRASDTAPFPAACCADTHPGRP